MKIVQQARLQKEYINHIDQKEKSSQDKISDLLAARIGLGNQGGFGVQDVAQGLTLQVKVVD